jgi:hypothetical protein
MADVKPTNPKDAIGAGKLPLELVPDTIRAYAALAFFEGASKYGRFNWRVAGVRASIYRAALDRHLVKWWNGEDADPKTGVPHLASVIACAGIILDAQLCGKLTDDRPPPAPLGDLIDSLAAAVESLKTEFAEHRPHQWTIEDVRRAPDPADSDHPRLSADGADVAGLYRGLPRAVGFGREG